MAKPFLTDEAKRALTDSVRALEAGCGAELAIAVRRRSSSYLDVALAVALGVGFATLAFLLYYPHQEFGLAWFLLEPAFVGALAGGLTGYSPQLLRLLTSGAFRRARVETAAKAAFLDQGVHRTSRRSGILLYISLAEREAVTVADCGIEREAPGAWPLAEAAIAALEAGVRRGEDGVAVAARVRRLGEVLAAAFPRLAGQTNELADEVAE